MSDAPIDLDAYFARIGYAGSRAPTLETLRALHRHHLHAIPFENLDVLLKRAIRLDPESLQRKLVANRRGGYCFESNGLLFHVLRAMGFETTALGARVLFDRPEFPLPPRTHMLQKVDLPEGSYIVDVAFGGQSPAALLRFETGVAQATSRESCRLLVRDDGEVDLESLMGDDWRLLYRFSMQRHLPVDFEPANWQVSTHPESWFVNNLISAFPGEDRRFTLFNAEFRTRYPDGRAETQVLSGAEALLDVLENRFGLDLAAEERRDLSEIFSRMAAPAVVASAD